MKCTVWLISLFVLSALLLSVTQPVLAQEELQQAIERTGFRPDAPEYAVRGPHWVGYQPLIIGEGTQDEIELDLWYPALNPEGVEEEIEYEFTLNTPEWRSDEPDITFGHALLNAPVDASAGPYPLVVFSHGFSCNPEWYIPLLEHVASYGFIVLAPEHVEPFDWDFSEIVPATVDRPPVIVQTLNFAEELTASGGNMEGQIDMEHVAVMGHSYGGYTSLAMAGAQFDFEAFTERCAATKINDPDMYDSMCVSLLGKEEILAERAGLDAVPEGLWPAMGDERVSAIIPIAGDSYQFDKAGLSQITVPIMAIGATGDTMTPYGWGSKPSYDYASSDKKALVTFDNAEHTFVMGFYEDMPWLPNTPFDTYAGFDAIWGRARTLDLTDHFATAFLLDTLKGDTEAAAALAPENISFPGIEYQAEGYGPEAALAPELVAEIEAMVEKHMAEKDIPGVSLGIVKDGEIAYLKGYGVAEYGTDRPMTPQSQFAIACVTKGFTTAAIMQLVDQGLVDLNAPVTDYLPYFKLADDRYKEITIHHLLANTAGLPMPDYVTLNGGFSENPTWQPGLLEEYVRSLADKPMAADPKDNTFIYGGDYFDILGDVIAKVTDQPFEEYMTELFLEPLGLTHSTFYVNELNPDLASAAHWSDEDQVLQISTPSPTYYPAQTPSNGMFSTTEDLMKWAIFNLKRGEYDGSQIVPASAWDEMWKPQTEIPWGGMFQHWGYGWGITELEGHKLMYWGGAHIGSPNAYYLLPEENMAVHVFANRSPEAVKGNEYPDAIAQEALDILTGIDFVAVSGG